MPRTDATDDENETSLESVIAQFGEDAKAQADAAARAAAEQAPGEATPTAAAEEQAVAAEAPAAPQTYTVQSGDSLSAISARVYGDAKYWTTIYEHNKDTIGGNPDLIQPGQELIIP